MQPNCKARIEYINGWPRIIIYTIRDIEQFEEITYDYQFNVDAVEKL
jgi:SET domain-containing protein